MIRLLFSVFALFLCFVCQATEITTRFDRLSLQQGLSQSVVNAIIQDSKGFMWFATADGLNRYDGYAFRVFRHSPQDPASISDNYITTLFEDTKGQLWVGTRGGGLNRFDPATEHFVHFKHQPANPDSLSHNSIRSFYADNKGVLWIGTYGGGLNRFDQTTTKFSHFKHDSNTNSIGNNRILAIEPDDQGNLWLATELGLNRFDVKQQHFSHYRHQPSNAGSLSDDSVYVLHHDSKGLLWVGTGNGLNRFDSKSQQFVHFTHHQDDPHSLSHNYISAIFEDAVGTLWIGTFGGGLDNYQSGHNRFVHFKHHPAEPFSISSNSIQSIFGDNQGTLWIGTYAKGINKLDGQRRRFGHVKREVSRPTTLSHNAVLAFLKDRNGSLWIGTDDGLNRYDSQSNRYVNYKHQPNDPASLSSSRVYTMLEHSNGTLWLGTYGGGLNQYNAKTQRFIHFKHQPYDPDSLSNNRVWSLLEDKNGDIWVATEGGGLNLFNPATGHFKHFKHASGDPHSLSNDNVFSLFKDAQGILWVGTEGGLNRYDSKTGQFVAYRHIDGDPHSLSHDFVSGIKQDSHGNLWVATFGGGLNKFNRQDKRFVHFREKDGLANDTVNALVQDRQLHWWLSTNKGLSRFDPLNLTFRNYDVNDGLQSNEFNLSAAYLGKNGELFFGGINGFNRFFPHHIKDNNQGPQVVLTGFLLFNQNVPITSSGHSKHDGFAITKSLNALDALTLNYRQNLMSFEFSALDFNNPMKNRYAYRLAGWDEEWIYTDSLNRRATYTNIPAGDYHLQIKASNSDGYWSAKPKSLSITLTPAPWQSWQAYLAYLLILLTGLYMLFKYRTLAIVKRAEALEQGVAERTETINRLMEQKQQMFANISHEFKTPLTLILNPLETIFQDSTNETHKPKMAMMKRNAQKLLRMIEQLLELSKAESTQSDSQNHVNSEKVYQYSLAQLLDVLLDSFGPLFQSKHLTLDRPSFTDVRLSLKADALEIILENLISNAIKYTPEHGHIRIDVNPVGNNVAIAVQDSGIGISESNQKQVFERFTRVDEQQTKGIPGAGIGLALVKELIHNHHGTIALSSQPGKGSTFTVTLPITRETETPFKDINTLSQSSQIDIESMSETPQPALPANPMPVTDNANATVLLIDDNADMLTLLVDTLSDSFSCLTAPNGEQGVELANEHLPDLVISDVMMPGISGHEVVKTLKQNEMTSHIPVILLSAKGDLQSRIEAWSQHADEYLDKPFNAIELRSRVDSLLSMRKLLRQRFVREFNQPAQADTGVKTEIAVVNNQQPSPETSQIDGLNDVNQAFLDKVNNILEQHYHDEVLDVPFLADQLSLSGRQLGRKLKSLLDMSPTESIRNFRLKKAAELLTRGLSPSDVAHQVGFTSHSYFSHCFKAQFGCMPSAYGVL